LNFITHASSALGYAGSTVIPEAGSGETRFSGSSGITTDDAVPFWVTVTVTGESPSAENTSWVLRSSSASFLETVTETVPFPFPEVTSVVHQLSLALRLRAHAPSHVTESIRWAPSTGTSMLWVLSRSSVGPFTHDNARTAIKAICNILFMFMSIGSRQSGQGLPAIGKSGHNPAAHEITLRKQPLHQSECCRPMQM